MKHKPQSNQKAKFSPFQTMSFVQTQTTPVMKLKINDNYVESSHITPCKGQRSPNKFSKKGDILQDPKVVFLETAKKSRIFSITSIKYNKINLESQTKKKIDKFLQEEFQTDSSEKFYYPEIKQDSNEDNLISDVRSAHLNLIGLCNPENSNMIHEANQKEELKVEENPIDIKQNEAMKSNEPKESPTLKEPDLQNNEKLLPSQNTESSDETKCEVCIDQQIKSEDTNNRQKTQLKLYDNDIGSAQLKSSEFESQFTPNSNRRKTPGCTFRLIESILRRSPRSNHQAISPKSAPQVIVPFTQQNIQKEVKQILKVTEDPKKTKLKVNLTTAQSDLKVIQRLIEKNEWTKTNGMEGELLWTTKIFTPQIGLSYINFVISRIPGMKQLSNKKSTSFQLKKSSEFFPELYNFYPKTYVLPENFKEFHNAFKTNTDKIYIAKPDKGTQGMGIFIVTEIAQLFEGECLEMENLKKQ